MKILTSANYIEMPWKNGGGTTTELFKLEAPEGFNFRISRARITQNGPFSLFPGVDRHLAILEGEGVRLNSKALKPSDGVLSFQGEEPINCELLSGPVSDFNVMIRRDWGTADVKILTGKFIGPGYVYKPISEELIILDADDEYLIEDQAFTIKVKHFSLGTYFCM